MLPTIFSAKIGQEYSIRKGGKLKKAIGQFFTPLEIARFMSERITISKKDVKILDPGFGAGILSCALAEVLVEKGTVKNIFLDAYENDPEIIDSAKQVLKYLKNWLFENGITLIYKLYSKDFIIDNSDKLSYQNCIFTSCNSSIYDIVISNPPYFKLSIDDERAKIAKDIINGHPNIYAIFMYLSVKMTNPGGEFVFIVPRSFVSGKYFKLFRERFLELSKIEWIHLFESRKKTFNNNDILQENVIIMGKRICENAEDDKVIISSSKDYRNLDTPKIKELRLTDILDINSKQKILHIPINNEELDIMQIFKKWSGNLNNYKMQISTGPVVSFRSINYLSAIKNDETYIPLYNLHNVKQMQIEHPIPKNGKAQFIKVCDETMPLLLKNTNCVLLRRFSTKDDKKRLIAASYFMDITLDMYIGVENHLNYIYKPGGYMERNEVLGVAALLNSTLFDKYFRIFNGNINVSATELRAIPLPPLEIIKQIGDEMILENNYSGTNVDELILNILDIENLAEVNHE
ncbi:MAG: Eco57I restriction-modification methylase domain-containing protein [Ignavibacteriae bacterium]|nr:Eco57I restriction-modification methylase domain-containing protein [Ignavibacteriota bacterium]